MGKTGLDSELVGSSEPFTAFSVLLERAAASDVTVLLSGESGTGKGAAARALHRGGARAKGPFVVADLAATPPTLIESSLFGHERGAFTDAHTARRGLFRRAEGGTLVLDDVDLLPGPLQSRLLRVLQEHEVEPVGAEAPVPVDARVVATTNRDLAGEVEAGRFREDLYYRLAVVRLELPPLRVRRADLPELIEHLSRRLGRRPGVAARPLSEAARQRLLEHPWPGNVRELENALERVFVLGGDPARAVEADELDFLDEACGGVADDLATQALRHGLTVDDLTRALLERALDEQRGNVSAAARQVGLTRRAFDYRLAHAAEGPGARGEAS